MSNQNIKIIRKYEFCAAHQLYNKKWSDEKNLATFGKCSNPNFHGHNYTVWIELKGPVDPDSGMVYNLSELKELLKNNIGKDFDHKNLNLEVAEFKTLIPTAENIAIVIFNRLEKHLGKLLYSVKLQETSNNFVEYCPSQNK